MSDAATGQWWDAPTAAGPVNAVMSIPGSKSLTNRYLVLGALAAGGSRVHAPLHSRDSDLMVAALRTLGATITPDDDGGWVFETPLGTAPADPRAIDCGLAGTVMRFVPPLAALVPGVTQFDGDPAARRRPMNAVLDALGQLDVEVDDDGGFLPFSVAGSGTVRGGRVVVDASGSSQFVSGLLLAGSSFTEGLHLVHQGSPVPSLPHVDMTVEVLAQAGVVVDASTRNEWIVPPGQPQPFEVAVEPDLSNAGPFLAAALATGGRVGIRGWPKRTTQGGDHWRHILPAFGARVEYDGDVLTATGPEKLQPVDLDLSEAGELAPTVAALCALAEGTSTLRGIAHLRGHETDRLAALEAELTKVGAVVSQTDDGLVITGGPLRAADLETYEDHRMATSAALLGLVVDGVRVRDVGTTAKTLPDFVGLWRQMRNA